MPNQATNFQECMAENLQQIFLGQGHFEESATWYDTEASAARPITVCDVTAQGQQAQEKHHQATGRTVHFLVTKDATLGTVSPAMGNTILRADGTRWGFERIVNDCPSAWILEFVGGSLNRVGMGRPANL
jgi:hypothetical protein